MITANYIATLKTGYAFKVVINFRRVTLNFKTISN